MHISRLTAASDADQALWSRILAEAEEAAGSEHVLAPLIADQITSRANLADAICNRVASLLAPPLAAAPLISAFGLLLTEGRASPEGEARRPDRGGRVRKYRNRCKRAHWRRIGRS
jgi:hypothetical protein